MLFQISSVAASATSADSLTCELKTWKYLIMMVFKLPNLKARDELELGFWWHINSHIAYKKLMLQGYFLAMFNFYNGDKFVHGPMEKDEVYLHGYLSRLVYVEMAVSFLGTRVPKKQVEC